MKYLICYVGLFLICRLSFAQNPPTFDSLLQVLETDASSLTVQEKEDILLQMSIAYDYMDSAETMQYVNKCLALAKKTQYPPLEINAWYNLGWFKMNIGDYEATESIFKKMLDLATQYHDLMGTANAFNGLCILERSRGNVEEAIGYCRKCLEAKRQHGDEASLSSTYLNLTLIFKDMGHYQKALECALNSLEIGERLNSLSIQQNSHFEIGNIYNRLNNFKKSDFHLSRSLGIAEELKNQAKVCQVLTSIASAYEGQDSYEKALQFAIKALDIQQSFGPHPNLGALFGLIANAYFHTDEQDSALAYAFRSIELFEHLNMEADQAYPLITIGQVYAQRLQWRASRSYLMLAKTLSLKHGRKEAIKLSSEQLSITEAALSNYQAAYENQILFKQMSDSLLNEDNTRAITLLESEYQYNQQKDSIQSANQQEKIRLDQTIKQQQKKQYLISGAVLVLLIIVYILYRYYQSKQKSNVLLSQRNKEIEQQRTELASLDKAKSRFFANISHELRTPLTLISSPLESLMQKREYHHQTVEMALRNTRKLKVLVNDILDLSKLESDKPKVKKEPTELSTYIKRIYSNYESFAQELNINYSLDLAETLPLWIMIDKARVEKALNNLLFNAIKYTESGGQISLTIRDTEGHMSLSISDTGPGIAPEDLPYIFDRYYQSKQPHAPLQGGTGIGLALARELVLMMAGDLTVTSEYGKGSVFTITLPLEVVDAPLTTGLQTETTTTENRSVALADDHALPTGVNAEAQHHVLVVEDNHDMQAHLKQLLGENYEVTLAINGIKALEQLEQRPFDLVITDAMMPGMDGFQLLEHLKSSDANRNIPVVMLTALNLEESKLQALMLGVDDYLTKPFSPSELLARVSNLITRYEVRKALKLEESPEDQPVNHTREETATNVIYKSDLEWLKEVETVVKKELTNSDYQITHLADAFHLSKRQFQRKLKLLTGMTYTEYHHEIALQMARGFLETEVYGNVTGVGYAVGINNPSRFSDMYYQRFGKKPVDYFKERISG